MSNHVEQLQMIAITETRDQEWVVAAICLMKEALEAKLEDRVREKKP
jgi:hypothetical protein